MPELLLINPGAREIIYQGLGSELTAVEPPLWCRLIAGYVRDRGFSASIIDAEALGLSPGQVAAEVAAQGPGLVCIAAYGHQPSASTQQMVGAGALAKAIKAASSGLPVIMVGGHVAALPERTLREEAIDFASNGEGPATVLALLQGAPRYIVPGLVYRDMDGKVQQNKAAPLIAMSDLHGDAWDLLPMDRYRAHNWQCFGDLGQRQPYAAVMTSLGCPYKCSFCCINAPFASASAGGNRYRMRDPQDVVDELVMLWRNHRVATVKIIDEMFVLNERHYTAICEGILAAKAHDALPDHLNIWAYARIDTVKPHTLAMFKKAGIQWLALGIESGSAHVRDGAEKALKSDDIVAVVRAIQGAGINVIGNFIFGLPDDTHESMRETLDLALGLRCEFVNLYSAMGYPGSRLFDNTPVRDLPASWAGYSQHSYSTRPLPTATLTAAEVLRFRDAAFHEYFADPVYLASIEAKFGPETRAHVAAMAAHRLPRELLAA